MNPKYTIEQYEALKAAYASGALSVKYGEQAMTYHSASEMRKILNEIEVELNISQPRGPLDNIVRGVYCKGL